MRRLISVALLVSATGCTIAPHDPDAARNIRAGGFERESADIGHIQDLRGITLQRLGRPSATGAVVGVAAGAAIGNQIGKGNGKKAATVVGAVVGGVVGNAVAEQNAPRINVPGVEIVVRIHATGQLVTVTQEQSDRDAFYIGQPVKIIYPQNIALVVPN